MQLETRTVELFAQDTPLELRIAEGDKPAQLVGYAAVFDSMSADLGGFKERIKPGAFRSSVTGGTDIRALVDHDPSKLLGRTSAGTLRLQEDARGLRVEVDMPDASYANDLRSLIKRGDIKGMSFGFIVPKGGDRFISEGGKTVRELNTIDLREVTVTATPAYGATDINLRVDPGVSARIATAEKTPILDAAKRKYRDQIFLNG